MYATNDHFKQYLTPVFDEVLKKLSEDEEMAASDVFSDTEDGKGPMGVKLVEPKKLRNRSRSPRR